MKSKCCNSQVKVGGDDREGTHYYVCTKCENACDLTSHLGSSELLQCPFCNGEASISFGKMANDTPWKYIECVKCGASAEPDIWNKRATPAKQIADEKDADYKYDMARKPKTITEDEVNLLTKLIGSHTALSIKQSRALAIHILSDGYCNILKHNYYGSKDYVTGWFDAMSSCREHSIKTTNPPINTLNKTGLKALNRKKLFEIINRHKYSNGAVDEIISTFDELKSLNYDAIKDIGIDLIDTYFPKGQCRERGQAIVLYSQLLNLICTKFGKPAGITDKKE